MRNHMGLTDSFKVCSNVNILFLQEYYKFAYFCKLKIYDHHIIQYQENNCNQVDQNFLLKIHKFGSIIEHQNIFYNYNYIMYKTFYCLQHKNHDICYKLEELIIHLSKLLLDLYNVVYLDLFVIININFTIYINYLKFSIYTQVSTVSILVQQEDIFHNFVSHFDKKIHDF